MHEQLFDLGGAAAVITGGTGTLGREMASGLARAGAKVAVLGRREDKATQVAETLAADGGESLALSADVSDRQQLHGAREAVLREWGQVDILVNAAGGNVPEATLDDQSTIFDLTEDGFRKAMDLNLMGTLAATQVFGEAMVDGRTREDRRPTGSIVNISSMGAHRAMSRVAGYSAAKAAVENLTRWLAVDLARRYGPGLRVNAIAPGFFIGAQNRALLIDEDGSLTRRGSTIIEHTPAGRFGEPAELVGTLVWLCAPSSGFVNGTVIPVDGGFSAFSGV